MIFGGRFGIKLNNAQEFLLALQSGVTSGRLKGRYRMQGIELALAMCKIVLQGYDFS